METRRAPLAVVAGRLMKRLKGRWIYLPSNTERLSARAMLRGPLWRAGFSLLSRGCRARGAYRLESAKAPLARVRKAAIVAVARDITCGRRVGPKSHGSGLAALRSSTPMRHCFASHRLCLFLAHHMDWEPLFPTRPISGHATFGLPTFVRYSGQKDRGNCGILTTLRGDHGAFKE